MVNTKEAVWMLLILAFFSNIGGEVVTSRYFHRKAVLSTLDQLGKTKTHTHTREPAKDTAHKTILQKTSFFCFFFVFFVLFKAHRHGNCRTHRV
jgi:hypothetical protein